MTVQTTRDDAMDYRISVSGLIVLCLCAATPVAAQDKRALIDKMMEVTNISGQLQSGTQAATVRIITQIKKNNPTMPDDVSAYVQKKVEEQFSRKLSAAVKEITYQTAGEIFSTEDLQSIINFYASEAGQKLVKKMPIFQQQLITRIPEYLKGIGPEIRKTAIEAAAEKKYHLNF